MISSLMVAGLARKSWKPGTPWHLPNKICFDPPCETRESSGNAKESPQIGKPYQMNVNNLFWGLNSINHQRVSFCASSDNRNASGFAPGDGFCALTYTPIELWTQWICECFIWTTEQVAVQRMSGLVHSRQGSANTAIQIYTTHGFLHWCHQWSQYKPSRSFPYIVFLSSTPFVNHCHASTPFSGASQPCRNLSVRSIIHRILWRVDDSRWRYQPFKPSNPNKAREWPRASIGQHNIGAAKSTGSDKTNKVGADIVAA